jgi:hypothetical protein
MSLRARFPNPLTHCLSHFYNCQHPSLPHILTAITILPLPSHPYCVVPTRRSNMACHSSLFTPLLETPPVSRRTRRPHPLNLHWVHFH